MLRHLQDELLLVGFSVNFRGVAKVIPLTGAKETMKEEVRELLLCYNLENGQDLADLSLPKTPNFYSCPLITLLKE